MSRSNGVSEVKLLDVGRWSESDLFDDRERTALAYAEAMTISGSGVDDGLFDRVHDTFTEEQIVELTCTVAFENFLSKFHRALRIEAQGFCAVRPLIADERVVDRSDGDVPTA
ncbi:carboxymuconolactone decarboxylase family protein [Capillimicrobium parvum]|uniref:Carboxymuconolactone decarboxylase family protein n=1 Tax=Capillimicrobium parvum TaxID=2884022 RepID=A0A9E6Y1B2_9ACTN|nr:hypothetical protein [Capillimicrobium parvum]UGS38300.1 hypothetical protein DSM104329_04724 [Capillimicrobium parvum]